MLKKSGPHREAEAEAGGVAPLKFRRRENGQEKKDQKRVSLNVNNHKKTIRDGGEKKKPGVGKKERGSNKKNNGGVKTRIREGNEGAFFLQTQDNLDGVEKPETGQENCERGNGSRVSQLVSHRRSRT